MYFAYKRTNPSALCYTVAANMLIVNRIVMGVSLHTQGKGGTSHRSADSSTLKVKGRSHHSCDQE